MRAAELFYSISLFFAYLSMLQIVTAPQPPEALVNLLLVSTGSWEPDTSTEAKPTLGRQSLHLNPKSQQTIRATPATSTTVVAIMAILSLVIILESVMMFFASCMAEYTKQGDTSNVMIVRIKLMLQTRRKSRKTGASSAPGPGVT